MTEAHVTHSSHELQFLTKTIESTFQYTDSVMLIWRQTGLGWLGVYCFTTFNRYSTRINMDLNTSRIETRFLNTINLSAFLINMK